MTSVKRSSLTKICLIAATAISCLLVGAVTDVKGETPVGLAEPLADRVRIGDVVSIPDYYAESGGTTVKAKSNVTTPDGVTYCGNKFTADRGGRYVVEYVVNDAVVHTEECVAVMGATDMFSVNALAEIDGVADYKYLPENSGYGGVAINVNAGAAITFNREINMESFTKNDVFFEAIVEPETEGEADFKQMIVTLTDPEDSSSYFRFTVTDGNADGGTPKHVIFVNGAANGQTAGGYNYDREQPYWQQKDIYGTSATCSFRAATMNGESDYSIKIYYDSEEKALYIPHFGVKSLIVDYDDPVIFGGNAWKGFESGKAVMTVTFTDVKTGGGRVIFNRIAGISLQGDTIEDTVAPEIYIDLGGQPKAPNSLLGTDYRVFPCYAYDFFDSDVDIETRVLYENPFTGSVCDVMITDGTFKTDKLGKYTVKYVATDYSGNRAEEEISFECIAKAEDITLTNLPSDFTASIFDPIKVTEAEFIRAFGGNGRSDVTVRVLDPDGEEAELTDSVFVPMKIGDYKIEYTATDYYGASASAAVNVEVTANERTLFLSGIDLPDVLMSEFVYVVPEVSAKACHEGETIDCKIEYLVDGNVLDETRSFKADKDALTATVVCRALSADGTELDRIEKEVLVADGKNGKDQTAYFYNADGNMSVVETMTGIDLMASKDAYATFTNELNGLSFALGVNYLGKDCNFGSFDVILVDASDKSVSLTFKFTVSGDGVKIVPPHGEETDFPSVNGYFKFQFDPSSGIVTDADNLSVTFVGKDDKGRDFSGFGGGVYAGFAFCGVEKESRISLTLLNNQSLGFRSENEDERRDLKGPEIMILGDLPVRAPLNSEITVYPAVAYDVLSQAQNPTVQIQSPSGETIVGQGLADKNIALRLTEVGVYRIIYTAYDSEGQRTRMGQLVTAYDSVEPELDVEFSDMTKSVGDTVTLPEISASDESGKVYCDVFLFLPTGEVRMLIHSDNGNVTSYLSLTHDRYPSSFKVSDNKFRLEQKGKYVLKFMAYDDDYNLTVRTFTITVKG